MKGFIKESTLIQAVVFSLLLAGSTLGLAQDLDLNFEPEVMFEQVNINQADAETIALTLNGIGIVKAEAIVAYRDENGSFNTVDDLIMVNGVGEFTVLNNQDKIIFE
jgi:competence protein ComEA